MVKDRSSIHSTQFSSNLGNATLAYRPTRVISVFSGHLAIAWKLWSMTLLEALCTVFLRLIVWYSLRPTVQATTLIETFRVENLLFLPPIFNDKIFRSMVV